MYLAVKPLGSSRRPRLAKTGVMAGGKGCLLKGFHGQIELFLGLDRLRDFWSVGQFLLEAGAPAGEELVFEQEVGPVIGMGGIGDLGDKWVVV